MRVMSTVKLFDLSAKPVLITRPAARLIAKEMQGASVDGTITLDTSGILRIGVSFFDESLLIFNEIVECTSNPDLHLVYSKAPTMQSLKNLVGNRGLELIETTTGDWVISRSQSDVNSSGKLDHMGGSTA